MFDNLEEIKKEVSIELTEAEKELWRALYAPVDCSCCGNNFTPESFVVHELNCFYFEKTKIKVSVLTLLETDGPYLDHEIWLR